MLNRLLLSSYGVYIYITWIRAYIMYVLDRDKMNDNMKYVIVDLNGMVWYTNVTVMVTFKF